MHRIALFLLVFSKVALAAPDQTWVNPDTQALSWAEDYILSFDEGAQVMDPQIVALGRKSFADLMQTRNLGPNFVTEVLDSVASSLVHAEPRDEVLRLIPTIVDPALFYNDALGAQIRRQLYSLQSRFPNRAHLILEIYRKLNLGNVPEPTLTIDLEGIDIEGMKELPENGTCQILLRPHHPLKARLKHCYSQLTCWLKKSLGF